MAQDLTPDFGSAAVPAQAWTENTAIAPLTLPAATGGDGALSYGLTPAPPPGLTLDAATRTLSGTPTEPQGARQYTWTATDADGDTASLTFAITVAQDLTPTFEDAAVSAQSYTQGTRIAPLTLPAATGGDGALSYGLTPAPPPGVVLDAATRTLSGTPTEPQGARQYTWTATDADGDTASLTFAITVAQDLTPTFEDAAVSAQSYTQGTRIAPLTLPAATGGDGALSYGLTPAPPPGLTLDAADTHAERHADRAAGARQYTWTATDADGDTASLTFAITVAQDPGRARAQEAVKRALAAVARRTMAGALDNIGARFADIGTSGLTLAGQWVALEGSAGDDGGGRGGRRAPALRGGPARRRRAARLRGARVEPVDDGRRAVRGERLLGASGRVRRRGRGVQPGDTAVVGVGPWRFGDVLGPRRCGARLRRRAAHGLARAGRAGRVLGGGCCGEPRDGRGGLRLRRWRRVGPGPCGDGAHVGLPLRALDARRRGGAARRGGRGHGRGPARARRRGGGERGPVDAHGVAGGPACASRPCRRGARAAGGRERHATSRPMPGRTPFTG